MHPPTLPHEDAANGEALLRLLDERSINPDVALWWWSEDEAAWHYVLAGGALETAPQEALAQATAALADLGSPFDAGRLRVLPVDAPLLAALGTKVQIGGVSRVQLSANDIDGTAVPPSLVYRLKLPQHAAPGGRRVRTITVNGESVDGDDVIDQAALDARRRRRQAKAEARAAKAAAARARRSAARARRR